MAQYRPVKDWRSGGFYETENHRRIGRAVRAGLGSGRLISNTGSISIGKTVFLNCLQDELVRENKVTVTESLSVDIARTTVRTLIAALLYELSREKEVKIPTEGEEGEQELRKLVLRGGRPVALFIDAAHDLYGRTLNGLKRLMEVNARGGGRLSVVLIGHPELRNICAARAWRRSGTARTLCLSRASARTLVPAWPGCSANAPRRTPDVDALIELAALDALASRLNTPPQFAEHLNPGLRGRFRTAGNPSPPRS